MKSIFKGNLPIGFKVHSKRELCNGLIGVENNSMQRFGRDFIYTEDINDYVFKATHEVLKLINF